METMNFSWCTEKGIELLTLFQYKRSIREEEKKPSDIPSIKMKHTYSMIVLSPLLPRNGSTQQQQLLHTNQPTKNNNNNNNYNDGAYTYTRKARTVTKIKLKKLVWWIEWWFSCFGNLDGDAIDTSTIWCSQQTKQPNHSFQRVQRIKLLSTQESESLYISFLGSWIRAFRFSSLFHLFVSFRFVHHLTSSLFSTNSCFLVAIPLEIHSQIIRSVWVSKKPRII